MRISVSPLVELTSGHSRPMGQTVRDATFPFLAHQRHGDAGLAMAHGREGGQRGHHPENGGRAVLSSRQQARIVLEAHTEPRAPPPRQLAPGHHQRRWKRPHYSHLWEGCLEEARRSVLRHVGGLRVDYLLEGALGGAGGWRRGAGSN